MRLTCTLLLALSAVVGVAGDVDRLIWEEQLGLAGSTDIARAVTVSGRVAVLAGEAGSSDGVNLVVRGYNKKTGDLRWSDQTPLSSSNFLGLRATSAAGVVYVAGPVSSGPGSDIQVRAYTAARGKLLWKDIFDPGRDDVPQGLAANRSAVVVVGNGGNAGAVGLDFLVRAYHPRTGQMLWEDQVDTAGADDLALSVALTDTQVIVAGSTVTKTGQDLVLRAYEISAGTLLWERREPDTAASVVARGGRVFLAGSKAGAGVITALKASSGALLWQDTAPDVSIGDLDVRSGRVVVTGRAGRNAMVRVLDVKTGQLLWDDRTVAASGRFEGFDHAAVGRNGIYVAGFDVSSFPGGDSSVVIRFYDFDGSLLWQDRVLKSTNSGVQGLSLNGSRLFLVGFFTPPQTIRTDSFIRAYYVGDIEQPGTEASD